jgi:hypothetical protein
VSKKSADPFFFGAYRSGEKKNYNPLRMKMLWVETMQVVCVPRVAHFDPFFIGQLVNSWLDHIRHHKQPVPLGM